MQGSRVCWAHVALLSVFVTSCFAGRAYPISSEMFAIDLFKRINPSIQWDYTNYLVDLSGFYSKCSKVGQKGSVSVDGLHPETKDTIGGMVDYTRGDMKHVKAVNDYLRGAMPDWIENSPFREQIIEAEYFGCSVRPGCSGFIAFACLFTPAYGGIRPTTPWPTRPTPPPIRSTRAPPPPTRRPIPDDIQKSQAFTKEQYREAEIMTGTQWDRSHFLENLSGYECDCEMIDNPDWDFSYAFYTAETYGMKVKGVYGSTRNLGSTPDAMEKILSAWDEKTFKTDQVGCSLIPGCPVYNQGRKEEWVVIACIYDISSVVHRPWPGDADAPFHNALI